MDTPSNARLRLRLPDGLEIEAEGTPDFVRNEVQGLLLKTQTGAPREGSGGPAEGLLPGRGPAEALQAAVARQGARLRIRSLQHTDSEEACLLLIWASESLTGHSEPTAAQLAGWLRDSGFTVRRVDRLLQESIREGRVLASGARRSRRYTLTDKGRVRAMTAADRIARSLRPDPRD